jgi:hypothetical protein
LSVTSNFGANPAPALNEHVEDLTLVIDSAPEAHPVTGDSDHHLIQMPSIARLRTAPP